ncbi:Globin domain protein [Scytonema hofmannii PCC 7110]|uniref:Globin domain protein n=1 Tax=Scytonema hofmannii PCC 7110 TaxID=128403 RepID=A0A139X0Z2_9CYAN|nr:adenylate/guanylate cyclase domain-containing protein [Scytonema hofmannii]KYC38377.1 Globin domain protein [Scytonema hofmannii PCC 7110]
MQLVIFNRLTIKSKLIIVVLFASISSILIIAYLGWQMGKRSLTESVSNQLITVRAAKSAEIKTYFQTLRNHIKTLCEDRTIVAAMVDFHQGFRELNEKSIPPEWERSLQNYYENKFFPNISDKVSGELRFNSYRPVSQAAKYLQHYYIDANSYASEQKAQLLDARDGSVYSRFHAQYQPLFQNLVQSMGYGNLLLIDHNTGDIIYSVRKELDYGTNLNTGPYRTSHLAKLVATVRQTFDPGTIQITDFEPYRPVYDSQTAFIAGPIYDGSKMVGILVVQLSVAEINRIMTSNQNWMSEGLGKSGEAYLIGSDYRMRSPSRFALQDQLNNIQTLETEAVRKALAGETGTGNLKDYRGISVLTAYAPLKIGNLKWAILAQMDMAEVLAPVNNLQLWLLSASTILIVLFTFLSIIVSYFVNRPIAAIKEGIQQLQAGNYNTTVNINADDEFGELGRAFNAMVISLGKKLAEIDQKNQENEALLLNIVPLTIARRLKQGELLIADHVKHVTILYARVVGIAELSQRLPPAEVAQLLTRLFHEFNEAAERFGLERKSTIDTDYMAVCGLTIPRLDHVKRTVDFGVEMLNILHQMELGQDLALGLRIGIHTGSVTAGVIGTKKFGYNVWGESVYLVMRLYTQAELNSIVMTRAAYEWVADSYTLIQYRSMHIDNIGEVDTWILVTAAKMSMSKVDLVQSTFAKVQPIADTVAELFYQRLFELSPSLRPLFKGSMEDQQRKLMSTLAIAVEGLRQPQAIIKAVQQLGKRHADYGVMAQYYDVVGEALLWTLEQGLGEAFTPQVRRAWEEAYKFLSEIMKDAAAQVEHQNIGV